jgi:WD40 repeat protein
LVDKSYSSFTSRNVLGEAREETEKFRPQGRLITTLYEHNHPVNSITVTDDQSMFFTASKNDGIVHAWNTKDIERDNTSHSRFTIQSNR